MRKRYLIVALGLFLGFVGLLFVAGSSAGKEGEEALFILSSLGMTVVAIGIGWAIIKMDELSDRGFKTRL